MTARRPAADSAAARCRRGDRGFTLLEVLVSLGIIAGALAGIAALLPAAGSRLADATNIDRAATMAANARADLANRGLIRASLWSGAIPAIVFGDGLTTSGAATIAHATVAVANQAELATRIDPTTGFQLRDAVQTTTVSGSIITGGGYDPGVCYGCMLSSTAPPSALPPTAGTTVRLATVVFAKPAAEVKAFTLTAVSGSSVFSCGSGVDAASDRRSFLAGCSWVLAVGTGEPRWVPIASSWTAYASGQTTGSPTGASYLALTGTDWCGLISSGSLQVYGFNGLLRVDERFVNLE